MSDEFNQSPLDFRRVDIPAFIRRLVRRYETEGVGEWRYAAEVIEQQGAELSSLRARVAELEDREEKTRLYADRLAVNIKLKHFSDRVPDWQPLPDTLGILTQIDSMTTGIGERVAELEAAQSALIGAANHMHIGQGEHAAVPLPKDGI